MAKRSTKSLVKSFFGLGYHIWVIVFLANVLLVYSIQFYLQAAPKQSPVQKIAQQISPIATEPKEAPSPTPSPIPTGPVLDVSFTVPGIGTNGANTKPLHPKRDLYLLFYSPEVNSADSSVKPTYTFTSFVTYDDNPQSPTYTQFVNPFIDLGEQFPDEKYQLVFKMDQMLSKLVKEKEKSIGGTIYDFNPTEVTTIPSQTFIVGDIYNPPRGDNIMNLKDHDMLLDCFGTKAATESCQNKELADLNDDGNIDGTDYNIMLGSFRTLKAMGVPVPSLYLVSPTAKPTSQAAKQATKPSPTVPPSSSGGGGTLGIILFIIVLIALGVGGFIAYKKGLLQKLKNPTPKSPPPEAPPATETPAEVSTKDMPTPEATETPPPDMPTVETIDKEFYVKKEIVDNDKNGLWLTLTDDNGPIEGFYSKGTDVKEGFAQIKGTKKIEGEKVYIEISEIISES